MILVAAVLVPHLLILRPMDSSASFFVRCLLLRGDYLCEHTATTFLHINGNTLVHFDLPDCPGNGQEGAKVPDVDAAPEIESLEPVQGLESDKVLVLNKGQGVEGELFELDETTEEVDVADLGAVPEDESRDGGAGAEGGNFVVLQRDRAEVEVLEEREVREGRKIRDTDAFRSVNHLKADALMKKVEVFDRLGAELEALERGQVCEEVQVQNRSWDAERRKLPGSGGMQVDPSDVCAAREIERKKPGCRLEDRVEAVSGHGLASRQIEDFKAAS